MDVLSIVKLGSTCKTLRSNVPDVGRPYREFSTSYDAVIEAAKIGDLRIVKFLHSVIQTQTVKQRKTCMLMCSIGCLSKHYDIFGSINAIYTRHCFFAACFNGHLHVLKFLVEEVGLVITYHAHHIAEKSGNKELMRYIRLKWLYRNK